MNRIDEQVSAVKPEARANRARISTAVIVGVVVGAGAAVFASVPHSFSNGDTLQAADLNTNFDALDARISALETKAPVQTVTLQAVPEADTLDSTNYSVYIACPANTRAIGGGCSLFQTNLSGNWEYNSQGRATGCPGAFAAYAGGATTSRMCLRSGSENVGDTINDGNGSDLTVSSLGWKCSMAAPPSNTSLKAYAICQGTP